MDSNSVPRALIEFKKHTRRSRIPFADQKLSNSYPRPDGRKYNRLALLRDFLNDGTTDMPIVVLYYSITETVNDVKLERVEGAAWRLRAGNSILVPLPNVGNEESCREFAASLLGMIES